jgi:glycosyltransferase involved in cell wall biosynthesis
LGSKSEIYYHIDSGQEINWFNHNAPTKKELTLSKEKDLVILPESLIFDYWEKLKSHEIEFAIFVQNGYLIQNNIAENDLWNCYDAAKYILCISEDSLNCISNFFPDQTRKLHRVTYSIDTSIFKPGAKEKLISYMPRKMKGHSEFLIKMLTKHLPNDWRILPIDNISEAEVALTLSRSIIFLAFSDFEGLPLPPVEAAMCGNFVIGYTGNGGREYWNPPVFQVIDNGDIVKFFKTILQKISEIEAVNDISINHHLTLLHHMFSKELEIKMINNMLLHINS